MDINDIRTIIAVLVFVVFNTMLILLLFRGKDAYKDAAELPFKGDQDE